MAKKVLHSDDVVRGPSGSRGSADITPLEAVADKETTEDRNAKFQAIVEANATQKLANNPQVSNAVAPSCIAPITT